MTIQGPGPRGVPQPSPRRTGEAAEAPKATTPAASGGAPTGDVVELSTSGPAAEVPSGTLTPERLQAIARRLAEGGYETSAVYDAIAHGVRADLAGGDA